MAEYDVDVVLPRHWEQFCEEVSYSYPALKRLIKKQGETILQLFESRPEYAETANADFIKKLTAIITKNIMRILKQFA